MKKKDLLIQNTSLFAEVERRATENEGLKLKALELEEKLEAVINEKKVLEKTLDAANTELKEIKEINNQLQASILQNITATENQPAPAATLPPTLAEQEATTQVPEEQEVEQPEISELEVVEPEISEPEANEPQIVEAEENAPDGVKATAEPLAYAPVNDELRDYGAEVIGRVTRVTAKVLSKIEQIGGDAAPSLNTLALGKNESFKFAVLSLAKSGKAPDAIKAEMDRLANEAITYLESI